MSIETRIQAAVARADLIICEALRWLAIVLALSVVLALAVIAFRRGAQLKGYELYRIDYNAPHVDITSEGP